MRLLFQFCRILLITFVSEVLHHVIPLPIPASIYGIVILFLLLTFKILPLDHIRDAGMFLVEIMPVMFIPAAVGIIDRWADIRSSLPVYCLVIVISTVVVMVVTGWVTQGIIRLRARKEASHD